jgi:adenylate kinase
VCCKIYNVLSQPPEVEGICVVEGAALVTRADDTEETVVKRLQAYERATGPVIRYYRDAQRLDGNRAPAAIWREIEELLQPALDAVAK